MPDNQSNEPCCSMQALKNRGWSAAMIRDILGEPDKLAKNSHGRNAAPVRLYLLSHVKNEEENPSFQTRRAKAALRSNRAQAVAVKKRDTLCAAVMTEVVVKNMPYEKMRLAALRSRADFYRERDEYDCPSAQELAKTVDEATIKRWMVNFARHELSNYDSVREIYEGKVGVQVAAESVRNEVLDRIAKQWPELAETVALARR